MYLNRALTPAHAGVKALYAHAGRLTLRLYRYCDSVSSELGTGSVVKQRTCGGLLLLPAVLVVTRGVSVVK
jgi:hypothetical protein